MLGLRTAPVRLSFARLLGVQGDRERALHERRDPANPRRRRMLRIARALLAPRHRDVRGLRNNAAHRHMPTPLGA